MLLIDAQSEFLTIGLGCFDKITLLEMHFRPFSLIQSLFQSVLIFMGMNLDYFNYQ